MKWSGKWIGPAYDPTSDVGVFAFRRKLHLESTVAKAEVRVSADNRYKLVVNGQMVALGPQRGDRDHWHFETVDLAPYLKSGENTILALVWNFSFFAPMAQVSLRTAFLLDDSEHGLSTGEHWEVASVSGWGFEMMAKGSQHFFSAVGPGELIDARTVGSWLDLGSNDSLPWKAPNTIRGASSRGTTYEPYWALIPRSIPMVRYDKRLKPANLRHGYLGEPPTTEREAPLAAGRTIEAKAKIVLDFGELLCAYPRLTLSGPEGATLTLTYSESMWDASGHKGNRNEAVDKLVSGYQDRLTLGKSQSVFETAWFRTFRYLEIEVTDAAGPVRLDSLDVYDTGYPYRVDSAFECDDPMANPIWDVSLRTAERCAGETYYDCPYYEQLQYAGDTRIQAMIHYYVSRDRALARNAVEEFRWSLLDIGLTQSRYPNAITQTIPPFSLWWIQMQHDALYYDRVAPISDSDALANERILSAFEAMSEGKLEPFWQFGDWVPGWDSGAPPGGAASTMHRLTLLLARLAAAEVAAHGDAAAFNRTRQSLKSVFQKEYTVRSGLVAHRNDPSWHPSEHSEALYRIAQRWFGLSVTPWPIHELEAAKADRCTYYFSFYKHQAILPDDYFAYLGPWKEMIEEGLTTFAENPPPVRSDCHAWSAHPALGFLQIVGGVSSEAPGWNRCRIEPRPGNLRRFNARIAHPDGDLTVHYDGGRLKIDTPVPSTLVWKGKTHQLAPGLFGT